MKRREETKMTATALLTMGQRRGGGHHRTGTMRIWNIQAVWRTWGVQRSGWW